MAAYQASRRTLDALRARRTSVFGRERRRLRSRLERLARASRVGRTLAVAAPPIAEYLFQERNSSAPRTNRDERRLEQTLNDYVLRAMSNTTPFGELAFVAPARLVSPIAAHEKAEAPQARFHVKRRVSLNRQLLASLVPHLVQMPAFLRLAPLDQDGFRFVVGNRLYFTTRNPATNGLGSLEITPHLSELQAAEAIATAAVSPTIGNLSDSLSRRGFDGPQALHLIRTGLSAGLLKLRLPLGVDWSASLLGLLTGHDSDPDLAIVIALLQRSHDALQSIPALSARRRRRVDAKLREQWEVAVALLNSRFGGNAGRSMPPDQSILYEDVISRSWLTVDADSYSGSLLSLKDWIEATGHLSWRSVEQASMRLYYDARYRGRASVPLTGFFEDYYVRHQALGESPSSGRSSFRLSDSDQYRLVREQREKIVRHLCDRIFASRSIDVTFGIQEIKDLVDTQVTTERRPLSVAALVMPANNDRLVLASGRYFEGFGKYCSRFADSLPTAVREALTDVTSGGGMQFAEIEPDSYFNGDVRFSVRSPLVAVPGGFCDRRGTIRAEELYVRPLGEAGLELTYRGRPLISLDLGFLDVRLATPVRRILSSFMPSWAFGLPNLWPSGSEEDVIRRPSLFLNDNLKLAREAWLVPAARLPKPRASEVDFLDEVDSWRDQLALPRLVFARIRRSDTLRDQEPLPRPPQLFGHLRAWRRSVLVDFDNPFCLERLHMLARAVGNSEPGVLLELERPDPWDDRPGFALNRQCELLLQFDAAGSR